MLGVLGRSDLLVAEVRVLICRVDLEAVELGLGRVLAEENPALDEVRDLLGDVVLDED